jgi:hypothetical protein
MESQFWGWQISRCCADEFQTGIARSNKWDPKDATNVHIRIVHVQLSRRNIAAPSAKRWKKRQTSIAAADIRAARDEHTEAERIFAIVAPVVISFLGSPVPAMFEH